MVRGTTGVAKDFGLGKGSYAVIYAVPGPAETSSVIVFASEGKMMARLGGCQGAPAEALKLLGPATVILAPK